jgi:aldose 1-epimerase
MKQPWGTLADGTAVHLYTLTNSKGMKAEISDYGATVVRLTAPDRAGKFEDVVLGFDTLAEYVAKSPYFGCLCGRVGNRIAHGKFALEGKDYALVTNNTPGGIPCHLHGGTKGFDKVVWSGRELIVDNAPAVEFRYISKDGEEGYPGTLDVTVTYILAADNALRIVYRATTDKATPVNLTNHSYFNLRGAGNGDTLGHVLTIYAKHFTPTNAGLIPTGEIRPVAGTNFDFTKPTTLGAKLSQEAADEQLRHGAGYDHNFVLNSQNGSLSLASVVSDPTSGRIMETWTTEPGVQLYGGNWLSSDAPLTGKGGKAYPKRSGFCLETQHAPDSVNQPGFPSIILQPGAEYRTTTIYRFLAK